MLKVLEIFSMRKIFFMQKIFSDAENLFPCILIFFDIENLGKVTLTLFVSWFNSSNGPLQLTTSVSTKINHTCFESTNPFFLCRLWKLLHEKKFQYDKISLYTKKFFMYKENFSYGKYFSYEKNYRWKKITMKKYERKNFHVKKNLH